MNTNLFPLLVSFLCLASLAGQQKEPLDLNRIFQSGEFRQERLPPLQWMDDGASYLTLVADAETGGHHLMRYDVESGGETLFVDAKALIPEGQDGPIIIESFTLSEDETKVLLFTDSRRVWRSNTKGNYWVYNRTTTRLSKLGKDLPESSLMFAKFSPDNRYVAYVSGFNLFRENFATGETVQLTHDGDGDIINGTFDWVYEEEFGCRDGFRWSPDGKFISFWQLDASQTGTFYMINNTDSIYSLPIPLQYPKVGQDPSSCRVALIEATGNIRWIELPGDPKANYIPRMQWIRKDLLLIQQMNRKQNRLVYWHYNPDLDEVKKVYEEKEKTWVDIDYPDISSAGWGMYDLPIIDGRKVTRMTEGDGWRHTYLIDLDDGTKKRLTHGAYDVASGFGNDGEYYYFSASPFNSTQRYLYRVPLDGSGDTLRLTPSDYPGVNRYNLSPSAQYAIHTHSNAANPRTIHTIRVKDHKKIHTLVDNSELKDALTKVELPEIRFFEVTTEDGITIDGRMMLPPGFSLDSKYPVLFHVYGEPWGQVATDDWTGMWSKMLAQQGYIIVDMDNRGTPCLKGSDWRKSIYRKIGIINSRDQAMAAKEVLKWDFIDEDRVAVWGWSGGGSMTLNLMFRYPDQYHTGISVAPVGNQLLYDNIYQERYMGLPGENLEDFIEGSPVTYARNLNGNLLIIHGTGDDNVHYQNTEVVINELIKYNRDFDMMAYPNRSHGIWEGENTTLHLYSLMTRYLHEHVPPGPATLNDRP